MTRKGLTFPEHAVSNGRVGTARIRHQIGATSAVLTSPEPSPLVQPILGMVAKKRAKYSNEKTEIDGIKFDSRREAARWVVLRGQEARGRSRSWTDRSASSLRQQWSSLAASAPRCGTWPTSSTAATGSE